MKNTIFKMALLGAVLALPMAVPALEPVDSSKILRHPQGELIIPISILEAGYGSLDSNFQQEITSGHFDSYRSALETGRNLRASGECTFSEVDQLRADPNIGTISVADVISKNPLAAVVTVVKRVASWDFRGTGLPVTVFHARIEEILVGSDALTPGAPMTFVVYEGSVDSGGHVLCHGQAKSSLAWGPRNGGDKDAIGIGGKKSERLVLAGLPDANNPDHWIVPIGAIFPVIDNSVPAPEGFGFYVDEELTLQTLRQRFADGREGVK